MHMKLCHVKVITLGCHKSTPMPLLIDFKNPQMIVPITPGICICNCASASPCSPAAQPAFVPRGACQSCPATNRAVAIRKGARQPASQRERGEQCLGSPPRKEVLLHHFKLLLQEKASTVVATVWKEMVEEAHDTDSFVWLVATWARHGAPGLGLAPSAPCGPNGVALWTDVVGAKFRRGEKTPRG